MEEGQLSGYWARRGSEADSMSRKATKTRVDRKPKLDAAEEEKMMLSPIINVGMICFAQKACVGMRKRLRTKTPVFVKGHYALNTERTKSKESTRALNSVRRPHSAVLKSTFPTNQSTNQKFVPGTKMNRTSSSVATTWKSTNAINALFINSFRTYGSLIRDQFMKVYSLKLKKARKTSSLY